MRIFSKLTAVALLATTGVAFGQSSKADHLVLSEMLINSPGQEAVGDINEYIEIYNPTNAAIDLSDYFLTDVADYWLLPSYMKDSTTGKLDSTLIPDGQHILRFPEGSSIPAGGVAVVTWVSSRFLGDFYGGDLNAFKNQAGNPQLFETLPQNAEIPDMITYKQSLDPSDGQEYSISKANSNDMIVMFKWDGVSDLVTDVDMVIYGGNTGPTPKTGVAVDGPDADTTDSTYAAEPNDFSNLNMDPGGSPDAIFRHTLLEPGEARTGGNGLNGHQEVAEVTIGSWSAAEPAQTLAQGLTPGLTDLPLASVDEAAVAYKAARQVVDPVPNSSIQLVANVADDGLSALTVKAHVIVNGTTSTVDMAATTNAEEYSVQVGPYADKTVISWFVEVIDGAGSSIFPVGADQDQFSRETFIVTADKADGNDIMINEIYYDVAGTGEEGEFVEFYNSTSSDQPMGGFVLSDTAGNLGRLPADAVIPANGYLVLTNNIEALNGLVGETVNNAFQSTTGYNNGGDGFYLYHANDFSLFGRDGTPIDEVVINHDTGSTWPTDGNGAPSPKTTELITPDAGATIDNSLPANWAVSVPDLGTPGKLNSTKWQSSVGSWSLY